MTPRTPEQIEIDNLNAEVARLNKAIEVVRAERTLLNERYELVVEQKRIEEKNYSTALSVASLKTDWLAKAKELETLKEQTDVELRDAICIDFANKLRVGALADLDKDDDATLVLKATAYEVYYRACVATLENRNLRVKLAHRDRFTEAVKKSKEEKNKVEREKVERQRAQDPREKMIAQMMVLGMSREVAESQVTLIMGAAKEITK